MKHNCPCPQLSVILSLSQKLIGVQQTLIKISKSLEKNRFPNPGKTNNKSNINQLLFFNTLEQALISK